MLVFPVLRLCWLSFELLLTHFSHGNGMGGEDMISGWFWGRDIMRFGGVIAGAWRAARYGIER